MLTYRAYVYRLAIAASGKASSFALLLGSHLSAGNVSLASLQREASDLDAAVESLLSALPGGLRERAESSTGLRRHLRFIHYYLDKEQPGNCASDPRNIIEADLPSVLKIFDEWQVGQSPEVGDFASRVEPHIRNGQHETALREAWPIFKSHVVTTLELPIDLDGHKLAEALFGPEGGTAEVLEEGERQGYLNLLKGLYTLYRNPVAHNDVQIKPQEVDSVLILLNAILARVSEAGSKGKQ